MVQFPEFPSLNLCIQLRMICVYRIPGSPIRISADLCLLAAPRSFSQLATSFIGSWHLGIHPAPFTTYSYKTLDHLLFNCVVNYHSIAYPHSNSICQGSARRAPTEQINRGDIKPDDDSQIHLKRPLIGCLFIGYYFQ